MSIRWTIDNCTDYDQSRTFSQVSRSSPFAFLSLVFPKATVAIQTGTPIAKMNVATSLVWTALFHLSCAAWIFCRSSGSTNIGGLGLHQKAILSCAIRTTAPALMSQAYASQSTSRYEGFQLLKQCKRI